MSAKYQASITVLLLTCVYVVFNLPSVLAFFLLYVDNVVRWDISGRYSGILVGFYQRHNLMTLVFAHSKILNSVFNVLVYFKRFNSFRVYVRDNTQLYRVRARESVRAIVTKVRRNSSDGFEMGRTTRTLPRACYVDKANHTV